MLLLLLSFTICLTCSLCYTFKKLKYKNKKIVLREQVIPIMAAGIPEEEPVIVENQLPQIIETDQIITELPKTEEIIKQLPQKIVQTKQVIEPLKETKVVFREPLFKETPNLIKRKSYDFSGGEVIEDYIVNDVATEEKIFAKVLLKAFN